MFLLKEILGFRLCMRMRWLQGHLNRIGSAPIIVLISFLSKSYKSSKYDAQFLFPTLHTKQVERLISSVVIFSNAIFLPGFSIGRDCIVFDEDDVLINCCCSSVISLLSKLSCRLLISLIVMSISFVDNKTSFAWL